MQADLAEVMKKLEVAETDQVTLRRVAEDVQPVCDELEESMPLLAADIRSERAVGCVFKNTLVCSWYRILRFLRTPSCTHVITRTSRACYC